MSPGTKDLILLPTWRKKLEKESLLDMKQKNYKEALRKLNILLDFNVNNHDIIFGKLICLMELGDYDDAINLSEKLIKNKTTNRYDYLHVYLTLLFQTSQYNLLIEEVETELKDNVIPKEIKEQFIQLYDLSKQLSDDIIRKQSSEYYIELATAIDKKNHIRQWELLENLRKMKVKPSDEIIACLVNEEIHPAIKTVIFKWLQDQGIPYPITVCKLGLSFEGTPTDVPEIRDHFITEQVLDSMNDVEQNNPSLYILLEQVLYRYLYVYYPIMPHESELKQLGEALTHIGYHYLHMPELSEKSKEAEEKIKKIQQSEQLYLSIIQE